MIELQNFSKTYFSTRKSFCVHDISLKVEKGHIAGLLGPNGSGKTTIIKALCAVHYPQKGKILLDGLDSSENPEVFPNHFGYVPENSILPSDLTVTEFLEYCGKLHCLEGKDLQNAIKRVCEQCSLSKVLDRKIKKLSKGFQQRLSFAQALIHDPENLILDEPVSGLDPSQIIQMRNLIKKLSENKAILMSTHLLQEVYSLCTEIYIMNNGNLVAAGTESQIIEQNGAKNLEEAFIKLTSTENIEEENEK
jgi:ABC-2 type transport system ATP-binding protein